MANTMLTPSEMAAAVDQAITETCAEHGIDKQVFIDELDKAFERTIQKEAKRLSASETIK